MTELLIPPWIVPEREEHEWLDEATAVFKPQFAPGLMQRQSFGGLRLKLSRTHTVRKEELGALLGVLKRTRGRYNTVRTKVHFTRRGSFSGSELISNNTFSNGTTGFTGTSTDHSLSVVDRVLRSTRIGVASSGSNVVLTGGRTTTAYAPYLARAFVSAMADSSETCSMAIRDGSAALRALSTESAGAGLRSVAWVGPETLLRAAVRAGSITRGVGQYVDCSYISLARCALVDTGTNLLLRSDEFDNASWTKTRVTVSANATVAPDGTSTADAIVEDITAASTHHVIQSAVVSSAAADYAFSVALKASTRTWAQIVITENTGGTSASAYVDLSTGTLGAVGATTNWANARAYVQSLGDDWYLVSLVSKKTNAATSISARVGIAFANGDNDYDGDGSSQIYAWRATLAQSSVPTRLVQTVGVANTGTAPASGDSAIYVKGLEASGSGLLLPGDWIELNGELKQVTVALDSDAAGLGYLQFEPPLVRGMANDDPVIVTDPMGKFLVSNVRVQNQFGTQAVVTYDLEHIYE